MKIAHMVTASCLTTVLLWAAAVKPAAAQEYERVLLADIAADIGRYRNRSITLKLRLKYEDRVFNTITFYDGKNTDIVFDVEKPGGDREYGKMRLNLHEGMHYLVSFTVRDVGKLGLVIGDLERFVPFALLQLP